MILERHFGFRRRPFRSLPDAGMYYPASSHERVLGELQAGLADDEPLLLLSGVTGVGKTLLAQRLMSVAEELPRQYLFLPSTTQATRGDLLKALLFDLRLPYQGLSEQELRLAWYEACLNRFGNGQPTMVIVDEADLLPLEAFEEIRQWTNLNNGQAQIIQVLLLGQLEIRTLLERNELRSLRQRLLIRTELQPLAPEEAVDYLQHQLRLAGGRPDEILSAEAAELIAEHAAGLPRLLNQLMATALRTTAQLGMPQVDAEVVLEMLGSGETEETPRRLPFRESSEESTSTNETKLRWSEG